MAHLVLAAAVSAMPTQIAHPTITSAELERMTAEEQLFYLDAPLAHVAAFKDAMRSMRFELAAEAWEKREWLPA